MMLPSHRINVILVVAALITVCTDYVCANESSTGPRPRRLEPAAGEERASSELERLDAHDTVHQGNQWLRDGRSRDALEAYHHAEALRPDSPEIAFAKGLAHLELDEFEEGRTDFQRAATLAEGRLSDDALYSLGAADHRQAIQSLESNPQAALSLLESAMRHYHDVLSRRPDHKAAREANFKAAAMWQRLKEQLQRQKQQQADTGKDKEQKNQSEQQENQRQQKNEDATEKPDNPRQADQKQPDSPEESPDNRPAENTAQRNKQEDVSREQAERRLREMMQAIRDRKKIRRPPAEPVPMAPVEKDW